MGTDDEDKEENEVVELSKYKSKDLEALCEQYAAYTRVNLAEEHGQIVTQIAIMEEQLHTFSQLLEAIASSNSGVICIEMSSSIILSDQRLADQRVWLWLNYSGKRCSQQWQDLTDWRSWWPRSRKTWISWRCNWKKQKPQLMGEVEP